MRLASLFLSLCACSSPPPPAHPFGPRDHPEPDAVDEDCLDAARHGALSEAQPTEVGGFAVTRPEAGVALTRKGRELTPDEGKRLAGALLDSTIRLTRIEPYTEHSFRCEGIVGRASCFRVWLSVCQSDLHTLAEAVETTARSLGMADAELGLLVIFNERPQCRADRVCPPTVHSSTPNARYEPTRARRLVQHGRGTCTQDGDCLGDECIAWYLVGPPMPAVTVRPTPAPPFPMWCGCRENHCDVFTQ